MEPSPLPIAADRVVWDAARQVLRVAVFGAGHAVGREVALELLRAGHPAGGLTLFGREAKAFSWKGQTLAVEPIQGNLPQSDLAFLCTTPDLARQLVPILSGRGTRVIDLSGAFRGDPNVPLVLDPIRGADFGPFTEMIALPNRSAALLARPLWALEQQAGLTEVDCFALVAAASEGARGILEVREELAGGGADRDPLHRRVGNLLPVSGAGEGQPDLEVVLVEDVQRLLVRPDLALDVMAMEGDVERCDAFAVKVSLRTALTPDEALRCLVGMPGIDVEGDPAGLVPVVCAGSERVHVGRIRVGSRGPGSLCFFAVGDQLRAGAARAALAAASRIPALG